MALGDTVRFVDSAEQQFTTWLQGMTTDQVKAITGQTGLRAPADAAQKLRASFKSQFGAMTVAEAKTIRSLIPGGRELTDDQVQQVEQMRRSVPLTGWQSETAKYAQGTLYQVAADAVKNGLTVEQYQQWFADHEQELANSSTTLRKATAREREKAGKEHAAVFKTGLFQAMAFAATGGLSTALQAAAQKSAAEAGDPKLAIAIGLTGVANLIKQPTVTPTEGLPQGPTATGETLDVAGGADWANKVKLSELGLDAGLLEKYGLSESTLADILSPGDLANIDWSTFSPDQLIDTLSGAIGSLDPADVTAQLKKDIELKISDPGFDWDKFTSQDLPAYLAAGGTAVEITQLIAANQAQREVSRLQEQGLHIDQAQVEQQFQTRYDELLRQQGIGREQQEAEFVRRGIHTPTAMEGAPAPTVKSRLQREAEEGRAFQRGELEMGKRHTVEDITNQLQQLQEQRKAQEAQYRAGLTTSLLGGDRPEMLSFLLGKL